MIVCADDFGFAPDINEAILELVRRGRVSAVSCAVNAKHCDTESVRALREHSEKLDIGIHFCLTEAPPCSTSAQCPSIVKDSQFRPYGSLVRRCLTGRVSPTEVLTELNAQYDLFLELFGRPPDYIDSHMHVHQLPGPRRAVLAFLRDTRAPDRMYVRNSAVPLRAIVGARVSVLKNLWISAPGLIWKRAVEARGLPTNSGFSGIYDFRQAERYSDYLTRFAQHMESPTGILMVHPGKREHWRRMEYEALREATFLSPRRFYQEQPPLDRANCA